MLITRFLELKNSDWKILSSPFYVKSRYLLWKSVFLSLLFKDPRKADTIVVHLDYIRSILQM